MYAKILGFEKIDLMDMTVYHGLCRYLADQVKKAVWMQAVVWRKPFLSREEGPTGRRLFGGDWSQCDTPEIVGGCCGWEHFVTTLGIRAFG